jgi:glycosyltransferase involved in cell wall biosynthesis
MTLRSVAAVGDVTNLSSWSGTPYHFWQAAMKAGFATLPWQMNLTVFKRRRFAWNVKRAVIGQGVGGYQYSDDFLDRLEAQIPTYLFATDVITFNQHFPRALSVKNAGGVLNYYIDAPFAALISGRGSDMRLPAVVATKACQQERENLEFCSRVVTMGRWAAEVVINECGVPREKVFTISPGANLEIPENWTFSSPVGRAGQERDFVLGFVGKDWRRKGLPLLVAVRNELVHRGWKVSVHAAGHAPRELAGAPGIRFIGFIDKREDPVGFLRFIADCDVGCLFSDREALGISTLEFLRAGVPVAGFAHEGPADTLPPDAGFRFAKDAKVPEIADEFEAYLRDEAAQNRLRKAARRWSPLVTWERCISEFVELWDTGVIKNPLRLWLGRDAGALST